MLGAILGDIVGSRFEFNNHLSKEFEFIDAERCRFTDDTVMTCAVAYVLDRFDGHWEQLTTEVVSEYFQRVGRYYPRCGFGGRFIRWMYCDNPVPYGSCGNGSAMRITPVGYFARTLDECKELAYKLTAVTHDHPEGLKGAECTAVCVFLARHGYTIEEIKKYVEDHYYKLDKTLDDYRLENGGEHGREICQITVPQALRCFFDGNSYEDVIRNCVYIGGDTDTLGAIAGGIAGAYYGEPIVYERLVRKGFLDSRLCKIYDRFKARMRSKRHAIVSNERVALD